MTLQMPFAVHDSFWNMFLGIHSVVCDLSVCNGTDRLYHSMHRIHAQQFPSLIL